jgi:murein DD-endopeptidase MepM/ murein hydrolase activator NlpD
MAVIEELVALLGFRTAPGSRESVQDFQQDVKLTKEQLRDIEAASKQVAAQMTQTAKQTAASLAQYEEMGRKFGGGIRTAFESIVTGAKRAVTAVAGSVLGVNLSMAGIGLAVKQTTNEFDDLVKTTERIFDKGKAKQGFRELQEWGYIAKQSGGSIAGLNSEMEMLTQRMGEAARGSGRATAVLKSVGMRATMIGEDGKVRAKTATEMLNELAVNFQYWDKAKQLDVASKLGLSRSTITMLQMGGKELDKLKKEFHEYNLMMDWDAAQGAVVFNDQLTRLGDAAKSLKDRLAMELVPWLRSYLDMFQKWYLANQKIIRQGIVQWAHNLGQVFDSIWWGLGKIVTALGDLSRWLTRMGMHKGWQIGIVGGFLLLLALSNPITRIATVIAGFVAALDDLRAYSEGRKSITGAFLDWLDKVPKTSFVGIIKEAFATLKQTFTDFNKDTGESENAWHRFVDAIEEENELPGWLNALRLALEAINLVLSGILKTWLLLKGLWQLRQASGGEARTPHEIAAEQVAIAREQQRVTALRQQQGPDFVGPIQPAPLEDWRVDYKKPWYQRLSEAVTPKAFHAQPMPPSDDPAVEKYLREWYERGAGVRRGENPPAVVPTLPPLTDPKAVVPSESWGSWWKRGGGLLGPKPGSVPAPGSLSTDISGARRMRAGTPAADAEPVVEAIEDQTIEQEGYFTKVTDKIEELIRAISGEAGAPGGPDSKGRMPGDPGYSGPGGPGSPGNGAAPTGALADRIATAKAAMEDQLIKEGVPADKAKEGANLMAGQAIAESWLNPNTVHDAGTGYGIYGARLGRRNKMFEWLSANKFGRDSLEGQSRYMIHEAMTDPTYAPSRAALMSADPATRRAAMSILTRNFERPAKWWQDRTEHAFTAAAVAEGQAAVAGTGVSGGMGVGTSPTAAGIVNSRVGQRWGRFHAGTDWKGGVGTPVKARFGGVIQGVNGYGDVTVKNDDGSISVYRHISPEVSRGRVEEGQQIATIGPSGPGTRDRRSTGAHLHEELFRNGRAIDTAALDAAKRIAPPGSGWNNPTAVNNFGAWQAQSAGMPAWARGGANSIINAPITINQNVTGQASAREAADAVGGALGSTMDKRDDLGGVEPQPDSQWKGAAGNIDSQYQGVEGQMGTGGE